MAPKTIAKLLPRLGEPRCTCRAFSTQLPRLYPAAPPAQTPTPYYDPSQTSQIRSSQHKLAQSLLGASNERTKYNKVAAYDRQRALLQDVEKMGRAKDLERQIHRKWQLGDVYAPHDLSSVEMEKWRKRRPREKDAFDMLGINPLKEYKNFSMMSEYMTPMGRIKHRRDTGLRAVNQRKIAKAIRRAVGMGLIPSVHKHPEVLEREADLQNERRRRGG